MPPRFSLFVDGGLSLDSSQVLGYQIIYLGSPQEADAAFDWLWAEKRRFGSCLFVRWPICESSFFRVFFRYRISFCHTCIAATNDRKPLGAYLRQVSSNRSNLTSGLSYKIIRSRSVCVMPAFCSLHNSAYYGNLTSCSL